MALVCALQRVIRSKLREGGIFATQSGPAGVLTSGEVFSPINNTLKDVFPVVVPYSQHIPSFADTWVCFWKDSYLADKCKIIFRNKSETLGYRIVCCCLFMHMSSGTSCMPSELFTTVMNGVLGLEHGIQ